jgi:hypothetical protein
VANGERRSAGARLAGCLAVSAALACGCAGQQQIRDATQDVNVVFRTEYEAILAKSGTRVFSVAPAEAYDAVRVAMARLGMTVEAQDPVLGFVNVYAPAPRPLTLGEWREAADADLPRLREVARRHVGLMADFIRFEPEGLQIVINATVLRVAAGSEISLTMRMREVAPPKSGMPRREYAPPTAVQVGLDKIWVELEREFKATYRKP